MHTHGVLGEGKKAPGPATIPKASKEAEEAPITESQREILLASFGQAGSGNIDRCARTGCCPS
jgi:hypothetical protein